MSENVAAKQADVEKIKVNEAKWSKPLMAAGWTAMPSVIIEKQEALGLDAIDMNIILHLSHYWWTPDNLPHPSVETIAKAVGVTPRTIQKRIKALHELGLLEREERRYTHHGSTTNKYGFKGLIEKATPFAQEKLAEIQQKQQAKQERLARKKPKLTVVPGGVPPS
ncbi:MAG: helix-turn-helix domain-containing protein [Pseudomonadota bacterium]